MAKPGRRKVLRIPGRARGELWLIVDWDTGQRIGWGPWRSWSRFRTAVTSWRKDPRVTGVRVHDKRPGKALADEIRTPAGRP